MQQNSFENGSAGFVTVHVGAGFHSPANSELHKDICRNACVQAIALLREKKSALEAVTAAVVALENSPWTNAGMGSNLTIKGTVECDASIMDGRSLQYGAVGAVSGVKNPILLAESLVQTQVQGNMSLGRIPPSTMVGAGALEWAKRKEIPTVPAEDLITESSRKAFVKHKRKIDILEEGYPNHSNSKARKLEEETGGANGRGDALLDTVGAVCVDSEGQVASAVSSGGIILKQPGRLGQAALYGCGCWAENDPSGHVGVGVTTSGCGELLTKTMLARECAECLKAQSDPISAMSMTLKSKFLDSPYLRSVDQKLGGALAVKMDNSDSSHLDVEVLWAHTTDSMCLAYMSSQDQQPKALVSRLPVGKQCGHSFVIQSKCVTIPCKESVS